MIVARTVLACTGGLVWIALIDGISRAYTIQDNIPSALSWLVALGIAAGLGAILGVLVGLLIAVARAAGPARPSTVGLVEGLVRAPWWVLLLSLVGIVAPLAVAVPIRARLLAESPLFAGIVDLLALAIGWGIAERIHRRLSSAEGSRLQRATSAWFLLGASVLAMILLAGKRPGLAAADVWSLVLIGDAAVFALGLALLLPPSEKLAPIGFGVALAGSIIGLVSIQQLDSNMELRDDVSTEWQPATAAVTSIRAAIDWDGDGFSPALGGGDCDDSRYDVNPDGIEIVGNGIDDNCRGGDKEPVLPWPPPPNFVPLPSGVRQPKSVLIVVADAMRQDHVGVYGYNKPTTPRVDAFSTGAVRFARAYSTAATTRIAIPVLHTGRYIGEIPWDRRAFPYIVKDDVDTIAEILKKERGFVSAAFVPHRYLGKRWGMAQGFDLVDESMVLPQSRYKAAATGAKLAEKAAKWISEHRDQRFFVWLHLLDPHFYYLKHEGAPDFGDRDIDRYDSELWYTDKNFGYVLDKLDELGIADETMVVLLADHGEMFGEHGSKLHGYNLWEENAAVPLIIRSPGIAPRVSECVAGIVSIAPTVLNLAGIDGTKYGMSGGTLLPDMIGAPCPADREIVLEIRYGRLNPPNVRALVGNRYKLMQNARTGSYRLYDLENDPEEQHNLAKQKPDLLKAMKDRLLSWIEVFANRELLSIVKDLTYEELPAHAEPVHALFENGIELVGIDFGNREVSQDNIPPLQIFLRSNKRVDADCMIDFYLVDDDDNIRFHSRHPPVNGSFPVFRWPRGRIVNDAFVFELKQKLITGGRLKKGRYLTRLGLRCADERIRAVRGEVDAKGRVSTGEFHVVSRRSRR